MNENKEKKYYFYKNIYEIKLKVGRNNTMRLMVSPLAPSVYSVRWISQVPGHKARILIVLLRQKKKEEKRYSRGIFPIKKLICFYIVLSHLNKLS